MQDYGNLPLGTVIEEREYKNTKEYSVKNIYKTISLCENNKYRAKDENSREIEVSIDELIGYAPSRYYVSFIFTLEDFIENVTAGAFEEDKTHYGFVLKRWSKKEPYWCIFACRFGSNGITGIEGVQSIGGHYCIDKDANLHEILTTLSAKEWKVEIQSDYFL